MPSVSRYVGTRVWFRTAADGSNGDVVLYNDNAEDMRASVIHHAPFTAKQLQDQMDLVRKHGNASDANAIAG
jgi:hypothetical protein